MATAKCVGLVIIAEASLTLSRAADWVAALLEISFCNFLIIGSFFGGYIGAMIAISKSNKVIKAAYQFVTIVVAYKLLF